MARHAQESDTPATAKPLAPGMDFIEEIGTTAGIVWRYLEQNGPVTLYQLKKGVELNGAQIDRAIGWLAREGKCCEERIGSKVLLDNQE